MKKIFAVTLLALLLLSGIVGAKNFDTIYVDGLATFAGTTITIADKNVSIGNVVTPSDTTADGGGFTLLGATDKTIVWDNANDNWTFNQSINLASGLDFKVNNVAVFSGTALGASIVDSSLTSVGTIQTGTWTATVIDHERGGLEADVSAYDGLVRITGGATSAVSVTANGLSLIGSTNYVSMAQDLSLEIGVDTQAYDADLTALGGVTGAANAIPYFTAAHTCDVISSSANIISFLGSATYLAATQALSVEIGVDAQAYSANLDTFAALAPTANAQTLLESTNFLSMTQDLSLEIGVDTQAYDADLDTYATITPTATAQVALQYGNNSVEFCKRGRYTISEINAGTEILPAISGKSYRITNCYMIAYGGAVGTATTIDILGTATGGVKIAAFKQAQLTQSQCLAMHTAVACDIISDGGSFVAMDAATSITIGKTGGDVDTATGVDVLIKYVIE